MKRIIYICILVMTIAMNLSFTAHAYTEEEKAQAKAWLSAHGYAPTEAGANQAYQDYLNGKFDEELGVDVNGDGIPATTETSETTENTENPSTEASTTEEECSTELVTTEMETSTNSATMGQEASTGSATTEVESEVGSSEEAIDEVEIEEASTQDNLSDVSVESDAADEGITLYQPQKRDEYQEAIMVVALAMMLMLLAGLCMR